MIVAFARDLRDKLAEAVRSIAALARNLGTESLPEQSYTVEWMEPVSAGNWKGRTAEKSEPSFRSLWREFRESFENDDSVRSLHDCVEKFVEEKAQCPPIWTPLVVSRLGGGAVLNEYYRRVRSLALDPNVVGNVVEEFVRDLGSDTAEIRATYVVHGLSADAPFEIPHGYGFRPIDRGDIDRFGRTTIDPFGWIPKRDNYELFSDDWVCEIRRTIAKSDLTAFNELQNRIEMVAIATNLMLRGRVSFRLLAKQFDSPYLNQGATWGGIELFSARRGGSISCSAKDIGAFREGLVWVQAVHADDRFRAFRLPLRRLLSSATRRTADDHLVDCVIALESMLATDSPSLETTYRFRLRGAAILPDEFGNARERLSMMGTLYDLRSDVVHGNKKAKRGKDVGDEKLNADADRAEDVLRRVLLWAMRNVPDGQIDLAIRRLDEAMADVWRGS